MIDLRQLKNDETGQGMVEYGLIIGLIAIIVIAVFVALGGPLRDMFGTSVGPDTMGSHQATLSAGIYSNN